MLVITDGCFEENAAYPENDITSDFPIDLQECQDQCKKKQDCRVFTWTEGLAIHKERGSCKFKTSKRKTGKVSRYVAIAGDKVPGVQWLEPGGPSQRIVSGSVRNEENQPVWCKGKICFKIHLTSLL